MEEILIDKHKKTLLKVSKETRGMKWVKQYINQRKSGPSNTNLSCTNKCGV